LLYSIYLIISTIIELELITMITLMTNYGKKFKVIHIMDI